MLEYVRPKLYKKQEEAIFSGRRFTLIEASSKSGKTVGAIVWIVEKALSSGTNQNFWWCAPIFSQSDIAYRRLKTYLSPGSFVANEQKMTITLLNQNVIWFKSCDNSDSLYGEDVYGAVIDEATRVKEEAWHAIRSTLSATEGSALIIGNVKGRRNWCYSLARIAESQMLEKDSEYFYSKLTIFDAVEGGVMSKKEIESLQKQLPEAIFRELYLAEPSDDFGNPFGETHIQACVKELSQKPPVAFGIDVARKRDWFVIIGLDEDGNVCYFDRWRHKTWHESEKITKNIVGDTTPAIVDATGVGDRVLEELQSNGFENFEGFMVTPVSKQKLMESLAISIQSHEIGFPSGPIRDELSNFTYEVTTSGIKYSAPEGQHDDCVFALALASHKWREIKGSFSNASYTSRTAINRCVAKGRTRLEYNSSINYSAFFGVPGSTSDKPSVAIAHLSQDGTAILDVLIEFSSNQNIDITISQACEVLKQYNVVKIIGDKFAGEWPKEFFSKQGVIYEPAELTQVEVYRDFMPLISAGEVELLDNPRLLMQLSALDRTITRVGRDSVASTSSDNLARAVASLIVTSSRGGWATWQKLGARALEEKERKIKKQIEEKLIKEIFLAEKESQKTSSIIRPIKGNEQVSESEEVIFVPLPTLVKFSSMPCQVLRQGRWAVPKGTRKLNTHLN